jgi:hypothetical protein
MCSTNFFITLAFFEVPDLIVELVLPENNPHSKNKSDVPSLCLSCSDLLFKCDRIGHVTEMSISLKALKLEDMNADLESWKRILAMSKTADGRDTINENTLSHSNIPRHDSCSASCPDLHKSSPIHIVDNRNLYVDTDFSQKMESSSLPEDLDPREIFKGRCLPSSKGVSSSSRIKRKSSLKPKSLQNKPQEEFCPVTPPPSPRPDKRSSENLVQILITMADPKSPKFITEYGGNHKHVDVDFNTLDVLLTPDTFSCLRRFFADAANDKIESDAAHSNRSHHNSTTNLHQGVNASVSSEVINQTQPDDRNTETVIKVKSLNLKLAKSKGHIAEAEVSNISLELKNRGLDYFGVEGRLGSLEIKDTSNHAGLYPMKFAFQGDEALDFDYTRNGM